MRWFVEVTPGSGAGPAEKWVVEATQWQPALQAARVLRGDPAEMPGLSIELLEDGYRAVDPTTMARYLVRKAPDDTPLSTASTNGATPPAGGAAKGKASKGGKGAKGGSEGSKESKPQDKDKTATTAAASTVAAAPAKAASLPPRPVSAAPHPVGPASAGPTHPAPGSPPVGAPSAPVGASSAPVGASSAPVGPSTPLSSAARSSSRPPSATPSSPPSSSLRARLEATANRVMLEAGAPSIPAPAGPAVEGAVLASQRIDEPTAELPLAYAEAMWSVPFGTSQVAVVSLLMQQLVPLRAQLASRTASKMVRLAVFDHQFADKPERPPLATLTWKEWKGNEPEIEWGGAPLAPLVTAPVSMVPVVSSTSRDSHGSASAGSLPAAIVAPVVLLPPADLAVTVPAPAPAFAEISSSIPAAAPSPSFPTSASVPASSFVPTSPSASPAPGPSTHDEAEPILLKKPSSKPPSGRRLSGDELLADLFESVHELQFARDAIEGAEFALALALDKLQSRIGLVHLYDINAREFVVVRVSAAASVPLVGYRTGEKEPLIAQAMRRRRAIVIAKPSEDDRLKIGRWMRLDVPLVSLLCAPVELAGRFLGVIELANPRDGGVFSEGDGHALSYIAEQFAELVGQRGIVLDPDRIKA